MGQGRKKKRKHLAQGKAPKPSRGPTPWMPDNRFGPAPLRRSMCFKGEGSGAVWDIGQGGAMGGKGGRRPPENTAAGGAGSTALMS